ncbi:ligase-associated DNA damage response endonuclease PdeM [Glaciecola siphonariae]|uniref:Ligase-associated DNA damage response endonuclease PdeM n=1 Tax=Glaciecola siphonariae TaxID=521012 RepID=A0ABV9LZ75_9ALTE
MIEADALHALVMNNTLIPVRFCEQRLIIDGRGVLYWPRHDLLIFSDLHFEKGSFLTQFAHPLPRFDTRETLKRMQLLIEQYRPKQVICLGDSFHDVNADKRLQQDDIETLNAMLNNVNKWMWVLGNHDPDIPQVLSGIRVPHVLIDGLLFVHEPEELSSFLPDSAGTTFEPEILLGQIVGHYHPKTSYKVSQKRVTGKSFVIGKHMLLMPAFGKYTGGLSTDTTVIKSLFPEGAPQILLSYHAKLFML